MGREGGRERVREGGGEERREGGKEGGREWLDVDTVCFNRDIGMLLYRLVVRSVAKRLLMHSLLLKQSLKQKPTPF